MNQGCMVTWTLSPAAQGTILAYPLGGIKEQSFILLSENQPYCYYFLIRLTGVSQGNQLSYCNWNVSDVYVHMHRFVICSFHVL